MSIAENHKFTCQLCGCEFIPKDLNASYLKRNPSRYCSKQCRGNSRKGRVIIVCSNPSCKKLKEKRPSELKAHPCCDIRCAKEWRIVSGISVGKNNPAWRGGISYRYRGENWDKQREKALQRDEYTCQRCHVTKNEIELRNWLALEVHHIIPYHLFLHYIEANSLDNLKTLCRVCHMIEEHEFIKAHPDEPILRRIPKTTPLPQPCIDCHKIFQPLRYSDKACDKCMTMVCVNCGKDFHVNQYYKTKLQKFCSPECVTSYIRRNNRKIDLDILKKMRILRDQGLSYKRIAYMVVFSKYTVRTNLIRAYGQNANEHPSTHIDQTLLEKMRELSKNGLSTRKIATTLGIGKSTVARYLKPTNPFPFHISQPRLAGKVDQAIFGKIKGLRDKGLPYTKIGSMVGLCRQTIKIHLKSYKPSITIPHPNRKITTEMIEEAQLLKNKGLSYVQIGVKLGVSANAIWKNLRLYKSPV
ncbi:MAG: HNH endonuclease [Nitrososphaeraceae archaeon]